MKQRLFILLIALLAIVTGAKAQKIDPIDTKPTLTLEMYSGEKLTKEQIIVAKFIAKKAELTVKANLLDNTDMFFQDEKTLFSIGNGKLNLGTVVVPTDVTWEYNIKPISLSKTDTRLLAEAGITGTYAYIALNISVTINKTNFTDETFRTYVSENFDKNINNKGRLTEAEANAVKEIAVSEKGITSLKGVEYFTKLTKLNCYHNQLTSLDVSKNTALTYLRCDGNQLTSLDVSNNTALKELYCNYNQLTSLDVSENTALTSLNCSDNQLTSLDVSKNTALTSLYCSKNQLTELDVSGRIALTEFSFSGNSPLTSLDASGCVSLESLSCNNNGIDQLTTLNVSGCTSLKKLYCHYLQLTTLDVSGCTALDYLNCDNNQLSTIDVSTNTALEYLYCNDNQLTTIDVSNNSVLRGIDCTQNRIRGTAMTTLVESLPGDKTDAVMWVYQEPEGNLMTPQQVAVATGKGWKVKKHDGSNWVDYLGESVPADANGDGEVTAADVETISDYILGRLAPGSWFDEESADVVDDGVVDIQDLTQLIKLLMKNVSYLQCPDDHHPHAIDLGLPSGTKWACCNVGATTPEDYGGHYAWGETEKKDYYDWNTYIYCEGTQETCQDIGTDIAGTKYDVAYVNWGSNWAMPSYEQFQELTSYITNEWTTQNGVNGQLFTASNGATLFLPASGGYWPGSLDNEGSWGYYWSSSFLDDDLYPHYARNLHFLKGSLFYGSCSYVLGFSVRPVQK